MSINHYIEKYFSTGIKNDFRVVASRVNDRDPFMVMEEKDLVGFTTKKEIMIQIIVQCIILENI